MPAYTVKSPDGATLTERVERCPEVELDSKEEADKYFLQAAKKKYKVME